MMTTTEQHLVRGVGSNMRRCLLVVVLGVTSCARPVVPSTPSDPIELASTAAVEEPVKAPSACVTPELAIALNACTYSGVNELQLPRLSNVPVEEQWARAEASWSSNQWTECAELFSELSETHPEPQKRAEASYAAVLCFNNVYEESLSLDDGGSRRVPRRRGGRKLSPAERERRELERLVPVELGDHEKRMTAAFARYECLALTGEELVQVKYRRARIHYMANQWAKAATLFRAIVTRHADHDLAPYAANLYLDCLNAITQTEGERREVCRELFSEEVDAFLGDEQLMRDEELRHQLTSLRCAILWRRAEAETEAERYVEAAQLYLTVYREHRAECDSIGNGHGLDEVLYNAALTFESADRYCAAIQVRERLISEFGEGTDHERVYGHPSPWAGRALYQLGASYQVVGDVTNAIRCYEEFARRYPGENDVPEALTEVARLRAGEGLGDPQTMERCDAQTSGVDLEAAP